MTKMVGVRGGGVNFWASEKLSGRVHFEGYSPEWRVLSKLSVQGSLKRKKKDKQNVYTLCHIHVANKA